MRCLNCDKARYLDEEYCSVKCKILHTIEETEKGCWTCKKSSSGLYSKIWWAGKYYSGHKIAYQVLVGEVPKGRWVYHTCSLQKCMNPAHLRLDKAGMHMRKKRSDIVEKVSVVTVNLTPEQIEEVRLLKEQMQFSYERLRRIFNCSYTQLYEIIELKS